jgi:hypothetical protein
MASSSVSTARWLVMMRESYRACGSFRRMARSFDSLTRWCTRTGTNTGTNGVFSRNAVSYGSTGTLFVLSRIARGIVMRKISAVQCSRSGSRATEFPHVNLNAASDSFVDFQYLERSRIQEFCGLKSVS